MGAGTILSTMKWLFRVVFSDDEIRFCNFFTNFFWQKDFFPVFLIFFRNISGTTTPSERGLVSIKRQKNGCMDGVDTER